MTIPSFLGPDGCALCQVIDEAPGEEPPLILVSHLRVILTPSDCERIAENNRRSYAIEEAA